MMREDCFFIDESYKKTDRSRRWKSENGRQKPPFTRYSSAKQTRSFYDPQKPLPIDQTTRNLYQNKPF